MTRTKFALAGSALALAIGTSDAAHAQAAAAVSAGDQTDTARAASRSPESIRANDETAIGDIIVTATRQAQSLQKTPLAVTVVDGASLTRNGQTQLDDVLKNVPGVVIQGSARGFSPAIRGLGADLPNGQGATAINLDDNYVTGIAASVQSIGFYDLDRVEVLRGPQATLYGRNATGGVVNIISRDPEFDGFSGYGSVEVGNYNRLHTEGALNVPITSTLAARAAFVTVKHDGYMNNGYNDASAQAARFKLLWKPSDGFSALVGAELVRDTARGQGSASVAYFNAGRKLYSDDPDYGFTNARGWRLWSRVTADLGFANLTLLPAYSHGQSRYQTFFSGGIQDVNNPGSDIQKSFEARLHSKPNSPFEWSAGYYHYDQKSTGGSISAPCYSAATGKTIIPGPGKTANCTTNVITDTVFGQTTTKSGTDAVLGQLTIPITSTLKLIGGARYSWNSAANLCQPLPSSCNPATANLQRHDERFDYRAGLTFDLSPKNMVYATVATSNRAGGFNNATGAPFKPERLTSFEVGSKNRLADDRIVLNASAFYYDYADYQVNDFSVDFTKSPPVATFSFFNVAKAALYGGELEAQFHPTPADRLSASATYLHTEFKSAFQLTPPGSFTPIQLGGAPFPHSPKWSLNGNYSHRFDFANGVLTPNVTVRYTSGQYISPVEIADSFQNANTMLDLSLGYDAPGGRLSVNAYVKNVTNVVTKTAYVNGSVIQSPPRTFGAIATLRF